MILILCVILDQLMGCFMQHVLLPMPAHRGSRANSLITEPCRNWKDIKKDMANYCPLQYHKDLMEILRGFIKK